MSEISEQNLYRNLFGRECSRPYCKNNSIARFKAVTTQEAGRRGTSDLDQLEYATKNGYAILTHDRTDFEDLAATYFALGKYHCGIVILADNSPQEISRRLLDILNDLTADEMMNQIVYV